MKIPFDDPFTSHWSEIVSELESKSLYTFDLRNICSIFPLSLNQIFTNVYRTGAIITRGLYFFYPIFHCGIHSRVVYTAERLVIT